MENQAVRILRYRKWVLVPPCIAAAIYIYFLRSFSSKRRDQLQLFAKSKSTNSLNGPNKQKVKVGVNKRFFEQMKILLPILVPGPFSQESALLVSLAAILIARTWLDIWFSAFNGQVVKAIVSRDKPMFFARIFIEFGFMMWPLSITNNSLKLLINAISLSFRARLTKYAHDSYLRGITFYKVSNIDNRIQNADQLLTQDIDKFSDSLAHLYSDVSKPLVDIVLFAIKLGQAIGGQAPFFMIAYFAMSGMFLRVISPPFGKYTAQEQKLEGDFRFAHSRIITHSEEIAFYGGSDREKTYVNQAFDRILSHLKKVHILRFANGIIDSIAVKYCATILAYWLISRPVFDPAYATDQMGKPDDDPTKIMEDYSRNSSYLINLSQAVGRVLLAGRDLTRFAGYTSRVAELFQVLDDVQKGQYERVMVSKDESSANELKRIDQKSLKGEVKLSQDGSIKFDRVPIVTPNGDVLVKELDFRVTPGMNCLITGPNGCGKSSLFRILGDLWPLFGGVVTKPSANEFFYVPQKPYLALGTFRDQIIYPHTKSEAVSRGYTDEKILDILKEVHLEYLVEREGGWDSVQDWSDVLSGGEKQRVAMARLFYHRPQWAILDECTSAVSVDVEGVMYTHARKIGITLFTVSHRTSLFKYHDYLLKFDGEGGYKFTRLEEGDDKTPFGFSIPNRSKEANDEKEKESTETAVKKSPVDEKKEAKESPAPSETKEVKGKREQSKQKKKAKQVAVEEAEQSTE